MEYQLDETDPTPPEYALFRAWLERAHPGPADVLLFQQLYRAFQAGYHAAVAVSTRNDVP